MLDIFSFIIYILKKFNESDLLLKQIEIIKLSNNLSFFLDYKP